MWTLGYFSAPAHTISDIFQWHITVGHKITLPLAIILAIFLWFACHFLSSHACYKEYEAKRSRLDKYVFHKTALSKSFLTRIISSAEIILLWTELSFSILRFDPIPGETNQNKGYAGFSRTEDVFLRYFDIMIKGGY